MTEHDVQNGGPALATMSTWCPPSLSHATATAHFFRTPLGGMSARIPPKGGTTNIGHCFLRALYADNSDWTGRNSVSSRLPKLPQMPPLTLLLLLALGTDAKPEARCPGASTVFQCNFEAVDDYEWPPGWTRRHGPGFPRFVRVRVHDQGPPPGGRCLRVELDGGAATAYGPTISVKPGVRYLLEGYVQTSALKHDTAWLSLIYLDAAQYKIQSATSEKISGSAAWQRLRVGPVVPPEGAASILIGLHLEPQGGVEDLHGSASFGALWLGQLPHVALSVQAAQQDPVERTGTERFGR